MNNNGWYHGFIHRVVVIIVVLVLPVYFFVILIIFVGLPLWLAILTGCYCFVAPSPIFHDFIIDSWIVTNNNCWYHGIIHAIVVVRFVLVFTCNEHYSENNFPIVLQLTGSTKPSYAAQKWASLALTFQVLCFAFVLYCMAVSIFHQICLL